MFVSKKNEALLCEEFIKIVELQLEVKIFGEMKKFQEFLSINKSLYSDMQNIWDTYKDRSQMNLVLSGSIYSLMKRIFEDRKEPLFGRATERFK